MKHIISALLMAFVVIGCDFEKEIDMPDFDSTHRLAITAILDTDNGSFTLTVLEALPLSFYKDWQPLSRTVIRDGEIRLFEDNNLILQLDGPFDLSSSRQYPDYPGANDLQPNGYNYKKTGISAIAGKTYRLEAEIDGYEKITATTVMPDAPIIGEVKTDTTNIVQRNNVATFRSLGNGYSNSWGDSNFIVTDISLTDNSASPDYYVIQQRIRSEIPIVEDDEHYWHYNQPWFHNPSGVIFTGISSMLLVQDNPDYESQMGGLFGETETYDLYQFDSFIMSDFTFANGSTNLKLHAGYSDVLGQRTYAAKLSDYDPETDGVELIFSNRFDVIIKHISPETYKHYQSLVLQSTGMDFFTEPVNIVSNVENGYGCFSAINSAVISMEYERYYYPEKEIYYDYGY